MGLFNIFKKKEKPALKQQVKTIKETVPDIEKKYYQPDECYTDVIAECAGFERKVITFEERKITAIPSDRGLYPAEILLLEYCAKGTYPYPKNGYPGFWWFEYGIRDIGAALASLEKRGFITFAPAKESVKDFTIPQLKVLLSAQEQSTTGKKAELTARVSDTVSENILIAFGVQPKYKLTEIGKQELNENGYVPYMHSASNTTTEDDRLSLTFNVWSINKLLETGNKSNWKSVVEEQERKMNKETADKNAAFMENLKKNDPEGYETLKAQDQQIDAVQKARDKYSEDKDLNSYIAFWEMIWSNGTLTFEGAGWYFELPDLYIKAKRYDDALAFVTQLKRTKPSYAYKSDAYIEKIDVLKAKLSTKSSKN